MATWTWVLQGQTNPTTIDSADVVQFAGGTFNSPVTVSAYQSSMHVDQNGGGSVDDSSGNGPFNSKYINSTQVDLGGGTVDLTTATTTGAPMKITFTDGSSVSTSNTKFFACQSTETTTSGPTGVTFYAAEVTSGGGDSTWTAAETSGGALALDAHGTPATNHDFYLCVSASPDSIGAKTFTLRAELTYS